MSKKLISAVALAVLALSWTMFAAAGIPDLQESTAERAYAGPEPLSLLIHPGGSGHPFAQAFLPGTAEGGPGVFADATITLTLRDGNGVTISNFPAEDLWLQSADGGMIECLGGTRANYNTDIMGRTVWAFPLSAGGFSQAPMKVLINGDALTSGDIQLNVNSPDINGDGNVDLSDTVLFASYYNSGTYRYEADFNFDGAINLSDLGLFAAGLGARCP